MPKRRQKGLKSVKSAAKRTRPQSRAVEPSVISHINQFDAQKIERRNWLITWVGIGCIMSAFFIAWIFNLKNEFRSSVNQDQEGEMNWVQIREELDKTFKQVGQGLEQIKQIKDNASIASSSSQELTADQINLLKEKLLNEVASTTASSTTQY